MPEGIPVALGSHDTNASALSLGATTEGTACMIAGTWSVNLLVTSKPYVSKKWLCRSFIEKGKWFELAASPASATNLNWFVDNFCSREKEIAEKEGKSVFEICDELIKDVKSRIIYHPFLYGSPVTENATAGFIGIKGSDSKKEILRVLYEGVAFNHRMHLEDLKNISDIKEIKLTGGASKSDVWSQIFCDILQRKILITDKELPGCFGAAMYGAVCSGEVKLQDIPRFIKVKKIYVPKEDYDKKYEIYIKSARNLVDIWNSLSDL